MYWHRPSFGARGRDESRLDVTAGISMVELDLAIVEFMISSLRGVHPPMKDGSFSKQRSCGKSILQVAEQKGDGRREIS
jgi:hypothetical protein